MKENEGSGGSGGSGGVEGSLDEIERVADRVLSPERTVRWAVRILVLVGSCVAVMVVGRIAFRALSKAEKEVQAEDAAVERAEADRALKNSLNLAWFQGQLDKIEAMKAQEVSARAALDRHLEDVKGRIISRESDRLETVRLSGIILELEQKRASLILEYNNNARLVDPTPLPGHLSQ